MYNVCLPAWRLLLFVAAMSLLPALANADNNVISVTHENDGLMSSDDGHFTSGFELNWAFKPSPENWTQRLATALPDSLIGQADSVAFRLVHQIYTPDDIERSELIEDDRPYAGLVYAGMSLYEDVPVGRWQQATDLHIEAGLVGPSSLADSIQREVHRITNSERPSGWHNQLKDEPLLNLTMRRQWWHNVPLAGKRLAHGPGVSVALGNLNTYASAGYGVRWGDDASGIPTLTPNPSNRGRMTSTTGWQWYVFANVEGYYVAHNLTLDGNVFSSSHSVDRKEWVGEGAAGFAIAWDEWQAVFSGVQRTREFDGQEKQDKYGAITLSKSF
ncbi:lipid A deacylase LpxR family protein [Halomonas sp. 86]|uniref:lipid A deacylase LpxR family protein n=1 Tax=unclassified Halomonas TaxID=2609666 RepID=UPI0040334C92